jgi:16S rRNA (cytosine1402-N4)-methyltransferase
MEYRHQPVLLAEVLQHLKLPKGGIVVDATVGAGGHALGIIEALGKQGFLVGLDVDNEALDAAAKTLAPFGQQIKLIRESYKNLDKVLTALSLGKVDAFLFDLGVASFQLDEAERGFSYRFDAPLDMRFDRREKLTAFHVVNKYSEKELARVIREYGEEKWAKKIAREIILRRAKKPIERTSELAEIVRKAIPAPARRKGPHPARRTFQALRIEVNRELEGLGEAIRTAVRWLNPGGRIAVISYHSLEDRIVKKAFRDLARGCVCPPDIPRCVCGKKALMKVLTRRVVKPSPEEVKKNPRADSARLRVAERLEDE